MLPDWYAQASRFVGDNTNKGGTSTIDIYHFSCSSSQTVLTVLSSNIFIASCFIITFLIKLPYRPFIFLPQLQQTPRTHTPLIILADILHLVQIQLHGAALAFGVGICLALHAFAAALAPDNFVFGHYLVHSPWTMVDSFFYVQI